MSCSGSSFPFLLKLSTDMSRSSLSHWAFPQGPGQTCSPPPCQISWCEKHPGAVEGMNCPTACSQRIHPVIAGAPRGQGWQLHFCKLEGRWGSYSSVFQGSPIIRARVPLPASPTPPPCPRGGCSVPHRALMTSA